VAPTEAILEPMLHRTLSWLDWTYRQITAARAPERPIPDSYL